MAKLCLFNGSGFEPKHCEGGWCAAGNGRGVERCCGEASVSVFPQDLVAAYMKALELDGPEGAAIVLMETIAGKEQELNIPLL